MGYEVPYEKDGLVQVRTKKYICLSCKNCNGPLVPRCPLDRCDLETDPTCQKCRPDCTSWPYGTPGYCACHGACSAWDWECNRPVTDQFMLKSRYRNWVQQHTCNPGEWGCSPCSATKDWNCDPNHFVCSR